MRTFNKKLPHGTVHGTDDRFPEARYHQNGAMFSALGECVAVIVKGGAEAYNPEVHDAGMAPQSIASTEAAAKVQASAKETEVGALTAEVTRLERELEDAKAGDINDPSYTAECTDLQKQLTNAKRALTKATNAAAVLESSLAAGSEA